MNRKFKTEFSRMIQIPTGWGKPEKSEVLTKDMETFSQLLQVMQETCHTLAKSIKEGIPNYPGEPEKRTKKTPEWILAQTMRKCSEDLAAVPTTPQSLGVMLTSAAETEELLAKNQIQHELQVEEGLFKPLADLENDYKSVGKLKKQLQKLCLDMDNAKKKYHSATRQSAVPTDASTVKLEQMKEEYEDLSKQVDHARDQLTTEILSMMSREADCSDLILKHAKLKAEYYRQVLNVFDSLLPKMEEASEQVSRPLFGANLNAELKRNRRRIASVIETCTTFLYQNSLEEEGLFRLAGGASKVKMFKAAFDAQGESEVSDLMNYHKDHHAVASTLKCYLRELHEPLTTMALYDDWMEAVKVTDPTARCHAVAAVIAKLPAENYDNLGYLIKFLAAVASRSDKNKMTASNLAIVIGPNLFSNSDTDKTLYDTVAATLQHTVVELLITNQRDFFPGEYEPCTEWNGVRNSTPKDNSTLDLSGGSESGGSPRPATPPENIAPSGSPKLGHKQPLKNKKAPAPPPLPKRVENIVVVTPPPPPDTSACASLPVGPADEAPHVKLVAPRLYPDVSQMTVAPPVPFEPTVVPVAYTPTPSAPDSPDPLAPLSPLAPLTPLPSTVRMSPSPAPRTRGKGPAVPPKADYLTTHSAEGTHENGHGVVVAGAGHDADRKPERPPPPPPRQSVDYSTNL